MKKLVVMGLAMAMTAAMVNGVCAQPVQAADGEDTGISAGDLKSWTFVLCLHICEYGYGRCRISCDKETQ